MKSRVALIFLLGALLTAVSSAAGSDAAMDPALVGSKVQTDLEIMLGKIIPLESFTVQVVPSVRRVTEKKVIEGESISEVRASDSKPLPPVLPGFVLPAARERPLAPTQTKQVFKTEEREELRSLMVQVVLDQALSSEEIGDSKSVVRKYLASGFGSKAIVSFSLLRMRHPQQSSKPAVEKLSRGMLLVLGCAAVLVLTLAAACIVFWRSLVQTRRALEKKGQLSTAPAPFRQENASDSKAIDWKSELLNLFLQNPTAFRAYFRRQSTESARELCQGLSGPAFQSLLEMFCLSQQGDHSFSENGSDEQCLKRHVKEFIEFKRAFELRQNQFFGFIDGLEDRDLEALLKRQRPLSAAVLLRFLKPAQAARALEGLLAADRASIFREFGAASKMSSHELSAFERSLRAEAQALQTGALQWGADEARFWSSLAQESEDLSSDLEYLTPELKENLEAHLGRATLFSLDKLNKCPPAVIEKVLDDIENDVFAEALGACSESVAAALLLHVPEKRRELVLGQMAASKGLSADRAKSARRLLVKKFREVLA